MGAARGGGRPEVESNDHESAWLVGYAVLGVAAVVCGLVFLGGWPRLLLVLFGGVLLATPTFFAGVCSLVFLSRHLGAKPVAVGTVVVLLLALGLLLGTDAARVDGAAYAQDVVFVVIAFTPPKAMQIRKSYLIGGAILLAIGSAITSTWILFG